MYVMQLQVILRLSIVGQTLLHIYIASSLDPKSSRVHVLMK